MSSIPDRFFSWPRAQWDLCKLPGWRSTARLAFRLADPAAKVTRWAPMEETPALYREAAALPVDDPETLLEWVNRRGMLWWPEPSGDPRVPVLGSLLVDGRFPSAAYVPPFEVPAVGPAHPCVPVDAVQAELDTLRNAVRVHDALRGRGPALKIEPMPPAIGGLLLSAETAKWARTLPERPKARFVQRLAWRALEETVSNHLTLTATLLPVPFGKKRAVFARRGRERDVLPAPGLRPVLRPTTLAGCLWWQFHRDAFWSAGLRVCPGCGETFRPRRRDQEWHRKCYKREHNRRARAEARRRG